jgi:glyoxylase-like metal-dependent hydrolase (beta-lactamase superfamily II)
MQITRLEDYLYLVDLETAGIKNFMASYILKGEKTAIIETGPASSIPNLLLGLKKLDIKPEEVAYVTLSHIHLDHGGGAGALIRHLPRAKVMVHPRGAPHLINPEKLWEQSKAVLGDITKIYGAPEPVPEGRVIPAVDGATIDVGNGIALKVVETLGHASHHVCYYEPLSNGIFTGDAAGIYLNTLDVIVPTTPTPFYLNVALDSLNKIMRLKPKFLYYSHFGKAEEAIEKLQTYVRQIRLWESIARQGIENGDSFEAIRKRIIERDDAVKKALEHLATHPILSETALGESLEGFIDFVKKEKSLLK